VLILAMIGVLSACSENTDSGSSAQTPQSLQADVSQEEASVITAAEPNTTIDTPTNEIDVFQLLGVSYMTFRGVQVLIDIYDGKLKELRLLELSYFLLFFPSVSSPRRLEADVRRVLLLRSQRPDMA